MTPTSASAATADRTRRLSVTPRDAVEALQALGISVEDLCAALDADRRSLQGWISGVSYPQKDRRSRLAHLLLLQDHMIRDFGDADRAREWLHTPSAYLRGMRPIEVLRSGRLDVLEGAIEALASGVFV